MELCQGVSCVGDVYEDRLSGPERKVPGHVDRRISLLTRSFIHPETALMASSYPHPHPPSPESAPASIRRSLYRTPTKTTAHIAPPSPPNSDSPSSPFLPVTHDPWTDPSTSADLHFSTALRSSVNSHAAETERVRYIMSLDSSIPGLEASWRVEPETEIGPSQTGHGSRSTSRDLTGWNSGEGSVTRRVDSNSAGPSRISAAPTTIAGVLAGKEIRRTVEIRDAREKRDAEGKRAPMPTAVWADLMDTSKGRDKVLVSAAVRSGA